MSPKPYSVSLEISGPTAMWTRPDTGSCPVSYPAPSASAVVGIFSSILWWPHVTIVPRKVELCAPVVYHSYAFNYGGPLRSSENIKIGVNAQVFATVLVDVCYRLYADVYTNRTSKNLPDHKGAWKAGLTSHAHAYQAMFNRRLLQGMSYAPPSLGLKEFTASYVGPFREATCVLRDMPDIPIPSMLRQVFVEGFKSQLNYAYDTNLVIKEGVLVYPPRRE